MAPLKKRGHRARIDIAGEYEVVLVDLPSRSPLESKGCRPYSRDQRVADLLGQKNPAGYQRPRNDPSGLSLMGGIRRGTTPITPRDATAGFNKKYWWLGPCGHDWGQPQQDHLQQGMYRVPRPEGPTRV
jgi:hypothetical protein